MADWRRAVWFAGLALCFSLQGTVKAENQRDAQLKAEAKLLFTAVLADEQPSQPCQLVSSWDNYPIPEAVARKYLGLRLHAELASPQTDTTPYEILESAESKFFCGADEASNFVSEQLKQFEAGTETILYISSTKHTFPIFSDDYQRAVLVVSGSRSTWRRTPEGIRSLAGEAAGSVWVYQKRGKAWRRVTTVQLFVT
jgi:hypothetical protein